MVITEFNHTILLAIVLGRTFPQFHCWGSSLPGPEGSEKHSWKARWRQPYFHSYYIVDPGKHHMDTTEVHSQCSPKHTPELYLDPLEPHIDWIRRLVRKFQKQILNLVLSSEVTHTTQLISCGLLC